MSYTSRRVLKWCGGIILLLLLMTALLVGCQGTAGPAGPAGPSGPAGTAASTATFSGKVTNSLNGSPVAGVKITTDPIIQGTNIVTDASGSYSATLPIGVYTVSFSRTNFTAAKETASLVAGQTVTRNVVLKPVKPVAVSAGAAQEAAPGGNVTLKATVEALDGSTISGYEWQQTSGAKAGITNPKSDSVTVTLGKASDYKDELIKQTKTEDRFMVTGINPHALTGAKAAVFKVTVTTSSGKHSGTVTVNAKLPWEITLGIQNVPQGVPVLLHGKKQVFYNWSIAGPTGSKAELDESGGQNPMFTPDMVGKYVITERSSGATMNVFAGTWSGAISGIDNKGLPLATGCTACHNGTIAADQFTAWRQSGHAEIFTQNLNNPDGHWAINCAQCHTVGYSPNVKNGGFDEAVAEENWKVPPHGEVGYWTMMLSKFPKTAKLANIQCENCHGPNNGSTLHTNNTVDAARISVSSDVCGACHGEPLRHGRFQQWEESGHANYEAAIVEATVENRGATAGHCGRCHSSQGFLAWIKQADITKVIQGKNGNATVDELKALGLTKDTVHPQTCVTCHDPHNPGSLSGEPTNATVRIMEVTKLLPAGFQAKDVGKGALCITCHNTRNGPHNELFPTNLPTSYSAPHIAAQGDVLLGQSAYLVDVPHRSPHASLKDTCVTCHMEATPPPAEFSYNQSGTNHSFKASVTICSKCHSDVFNGKAFQNSAEEALHELGDKMGKYLMNKLQGSITIKDYTPHTFAGRFYDLKSDPVSIKKDDIASVEPTEPHGQQGFLIKFKSAVSFTYKPPNQESHTVSVKEAEVQLGDITSDGKTPVIPVNDVLVKAGWNYFLIHGDGSMGVHNPEFTSDVLHASIEALK